VRDTIADVAYGNIVTIITKSTNIMRKKLLKKKEAVTMPAIRREIRNSVDELAVASSNQFTRIDQRFDTMVTKSEFKYELDLMHENMVRRFDAVDRRFEKVDERFDSLDRKMDSFIIFMRGHEKRIDKLERRTAFA
jgi:hypothetical protein